MASCSGDAEPPFATAYFVVVAMSGFSAALFYVKQGHASRGYLAYGALAALRTVSLPALYGRYQDSFFRSLLTEETLSGAIGPTTLTATDHEVEQRTGFTALGGQWSEVTSIDVGAVERSSPLRPCSRF